MLCDYYIVRRGYLNICDLYSAEKTGTYYHFFGFSWHAYTSYLAGILINIVGFAGEVGRDVPIGAQYIYNINYFSGFIVSGAVYFILTKVSPVPGTSDKWHEADVDEEVTWGQDMVADDVEGRGSLESVQKGPKVGSKALP